MTPDDDRIVSFNDIRVLPDETWKEIIQFIGPINQATNQQIATVCKHLLAIWRAGVKAIHITINDQQKFSLARDLLLNEFTHLRRARISELGGQNRRETGLEIRRPPPLPNRLTIELEFSTQSSIREAADILSQCPELANFVTFLGVTQIEHALGPIAKRLPDPSGQGAPELNAQVQKESAPDECRTGDSNGTSTAGQGITQSADKPTIDDVVALACQLPNLVSLAIESFPQKAGMTNAELIQLLNLKTLRHLRLPLHHHALTPIGLDAFSKSELVSLDLTRLASPNASDVLNAISRMPRLERLILDACQLNFDYSGTPNGWKNLKHLSIKNCWNTKRFFAVFNDQLQELESLDLCYHFEIAEIQDLANLGELPQLKHIILKSWSARSERAKLPALVALLPSVEEVTICETNGDFLKEDDEYALNASQKEARIRYGFAF